MSARTQDEIVERMRGLDPVTDFLNWRREVLIGALDFEHAKEFLSPEATAEEWKDAPDAADVRAEADAYYTFALGKIRDHRGISAERSVLKLTEYAWLLGRDDVVAAMDAAEYEQYGAPKVKAFAAGMGLEWPGEPGLTRMAAGQPCRPGCGEGCGQ